MQTDKVYYGVMLEFRPSDPLGVSNTVVELLTRRIDRDRLRSAGHAPTHPGLNGLHVYFFAPLGKGFVELTRRYVVTGTTELRHETIFLGYRLRSKEWRLVELRNAP